MPAAHKVPQFAHLFRVGLLGVFTHQHIKEHRNPLFVALFTHFHYRSIHLEHLSHARIGIFLVLGAQLTQHRRRCKLGNIVQIPAIPGFLKAVVGHFRPKQKFLLIKISGNSRGLTHIVGLPGTGDGIFQAVPRGTA